MPPSRRPSTPSITTSRRRRRRTISRPMTLPSHPITCNKCQSVLFHISIIFLFLFLLISFLKIFIYLMQFEFLFLFWLFLSPHHRKGRRRRGQERTGQVARCRRSKRAIVTVPDRGPSAGAAGSVLRRGEYPLACGVPRGVVGRRGRGPRPGWGGGLAGRPSRWSSRPKDSRWLWPTGPGAARGGSRPSR